MSRDIFTRRWLFILFTLAALWVLYTLLPVVVVLVGAVIVACPLNHAASCLANKLPGGRRLYVTLLMLAMVGIFVFLIARVAPSISHSLSDLKDSVTEAYEKVSKNSLVRSLFGDVAEFSEENGAWQEWTMQLVERVTSYAGNTLTLVFSLLLILVLALFMAWHPETYQRGLLSLVPGDLRPRGREVLAKVADALWHWLIGQGFAMLVIGVLTSLGLVVVGMKFAILLGVIAGLFQIIPYFGPILSAIPGVLLALAQSNYMAFLVLGVYVGIQILEGNFITPSILRSEASMPPVLTITATLAMGLLFGVLGIIIACPLALILLVLYRELYEEMILHET